MKKAIEKCPVDGMYTMLLRIANTEKIVTSVSSLPIRSYVMNTAAETRTGQTKRMVRLKACRSGKLGKSNIEYELNNLEEEKCSQMCCFAIAKSMNCVRKRGFPSIHL